MWVLKHQTEEGSFYDVSWFPDRKVNSSTHRSYVYQGTTYRKFSNISLTAQVLITLSNAKDLSGVSNKLYIIMFIFLYDLILNLW